MSLFSLAFLGGKKPAGERVVEYREEGKILTKDLARDVDCKAVDEGINGLAKARAAKVTCAADLLTV